MAEQSWHVDVHQIRIIATANEEGEPTPEGIHHDENDFICMHLANRQNIVGGATTITVCLWQVAGYTIRWIR